MLEYSFAHCKGIGTRAERALWRAGIETWEDFLLAADNNPAKIPLSGAKIRQLYRHLQYSHQALETGDHQYFSGLLPPAEHWRLFRDFRRTAAYVDIETTGLGRGDDEITTIALYDGKTIRSYVNGRNLETFPDDLQAYDLLITYNGKCFDIPFMAEFFQTRFAHSHIDLRYVLKSLGFGGGLKGCEKQFGLDRGGLDGVDGYFAVLLWQHYQQNSHSNALETLLAYNIEDVVNLEHLMHQAYNQKTRHMPFASRLALAVPPRPRVPFSPDTALVGQILQRMRKNHPSRY
ncbi:MAG TPA: ribonuclease H-like domain-containing protein [Desulfosalsimonadaceae bacterium]|nr:ribonuclease H-like domain-containing protein [Desulfosalsimonadaceae bacterium]